MGRIELSVDTDSLLKVLEHEPSVMIRLRELACEKIAEQITQKAAKVQINPKEITDTVTRNAMVELNKVLGDHSKWPPGVAMKIEQLVKGHLKDQRVAMINEFSQELQKVEKERIAAWDAALKDATNKHYEGIKGQLNTLRDEIKQEARNAFFEVLAEARSA